MSEPTKEDAMSKKLTSARFAYICGKWSYIQAVIQTNGSSGEFGTLAALIGELIEHVDALQAELDAEREKRQQVEADAAAMREHLLELDALYVDTMERGGVSERGVLGQRTADLLANTTAGADLLAEHERVKFVLRKLQEPFASALYPSEDAQSLRREIIRQLRGEGKADE